MMPIQLNRATSILLMFAAWLPSPIVASALAGSSDTRLEGLIRQVRSEVKSDQAMQYMRQVYATDRWFTFPKFQGTAEYLARTMKEIGLQEVQILSAPADGVSQFGYWTMPLAWDVRQARLELVGQGVPEEFRVLADYEKVPTSVGMWSGQLRPAA